MVVDALALDNKWLLHVENTILWQKIGVRGHHCDRTSRNQVIPISTIGRAYLVLHELIHTPIVIK